MQSRFEHFAVTSMMGASDRPPRADGALQFSREWERTAFGVALALSSAERAAETLVRHLRGETVDWQADYADYVMHGINTFRSYVKAWYDDVLPQIFFSANRNPQIMRQVCSVLAGYVWDKTNPYVTQADRALGLLAKILSGPAGKKA